MESGEGIESQVLYGDTDSLFVKWNPVKELKVFYAPDEVPVNILFKGMWNPVKELKG